MERYQARRRALLSKLNRAAAIFPAAPSAIRNNDVEHDYRQESDFYYLTGFVEPECLLVLSNVHPEHRSVLFLRTRNPERETWEGYRVGVDEAPKRFGVDAAFPIDELWTRLPDYIRNTDRLMVHLGADPSFDVKLLAARDAVRAKAKTGVGWPVEFVDPAAVLHEMRLIKDAAEIDLMRRAAKITAGAHARAMGECRIGAFEYELEAGLSHTYRKAGSKRHAYEPIVASGANATILHYVENDKRINDGDLVLIDSGCELEYYGADITRTFPANGRFSPAQRRLYEIVLAAQLAAIELAKPGTAFNKLHDRACEVLVEGLIECGLLIGDRDKIIEDKSFKRYYPHNTSHWLGMDVHDVGRYHVDGKNRELQPGMVLTVEPGLYVPTNGEHTANEFRGIGIRIEDDILITSDGHEVLTADAPKSIDEIEAICTR